MQPFNVPPEKLFRRCIKDETDLGAHQSLSLASTFDIQCEGWWQEVPATLGILIKCGLSLFLTYEDESLY